MGCEKFNSRGRAIAAILLFGAILLTFQGCKGGSPGSSEAGGAASPTDIIATVNGDTITSAQLYDAMQHYVPAQLPNFPQNPMVGEPAGMTALQNLIQTALLLQVAKSQGVPATDADVAQYYNAQKLRHEVQNVTPFENLLTQQGYTGKTYQDEVLRPAVAQFNLLTKGNSVTPAEVLAWYNANVSLFTLPNRVHVQRIIVGSKADADNAYSAVNKGGALSAFAGMNLAQPVRGAADTIDVPQWINIEKPAAPIASAIQALKDVPAGRAVKPVVVSGQWWVMKVLEKKPKQVLKYDDVKDLARLQLLQQRAGNKAAGGLQDAMQQAMEGAAITIRPVQYQSLILRLKPQVQHPTSPVGKGASAAPKK